MKSYLPVRVESHRFSTGDLIGGDAALDFINTVTGRDQSPRDWLDSYTRLLEWAALVHLLPEKILRALARKAQSEPTAAATALARAKKLRETLFALVTGIVSGSAPPKNTLALLRQHWIAGINAHELRFDHGHVVAELRSDAADFDLIAAAHAVKRGVALNAPRIAASALYGVDAANVQIDDYQFAISLDRHRIGDVGAAPKIGRHLAANSRMSGPDQYPAPGPPTPCAPAPMSW